jgi:putative transposase
VSKHERENAQLLGAIKHSHEASDGTYGSPRVVRDLIDAGFSCSENRVARLMKAAGIKARHKRRRAPGQLDSPVHAIAPNLLDRQFEATGPNQKWAADFTYVWTGEGWLFVAVVLDLYSRRVDLHWSTRRRNCDSGQQRLCTLDWASCGRHQISQIFERGRMGRTGFLYTSWLNS